MQTIGERLEDARKQKGISIREAAESTKVRGEYLQKFENNQFDLGLSEIYVRGFLRTYANFLKLPPDRILNDYASLGHGELRPRQPSREVYGRMDVSVASADGRGDRGDRGTPPAAETPSDSQRSQPKQSRSRTNLPSAPLVDPAFALKAVKVVGGIVVFLLLVWGVRAIYQSVTTTDTASKPAALPPVATAPAAEPTITLIALDTVRLKVVLVSDGRVLFPDTNLSRGQTQVVPKPGPVFITASALENVAIEENGRRTNLRDQGFKGYDRVKLGQ